MRLIATAVRPCLIDTEDSDRTGTGGWRDKARSGTTGSFAALPNSLAVSSLLCLSRNDRYRVIRSAADKKNRDRGDANLPTPTLGAAHGIPASLAIRAHLNNA